MTQQVNVPGIGILNFPDDMSQDDMAAAIKKNFPQIHNQAISAESGSTSDADIGTLGRIKALSSDLMKNGQQDKTKAVLESYAAPFESAANIVTGLGSSAVGGYTGVVNALKSGIQSQIDKGIHVPTQEDIEEAVNKGTKASQSIQQEYTYQPRTTAGKLISELAAAPIVGLSHAGGKVAGDVAASIGGEELRPAFETLGELGPQAVAAIEGGRAAMPGAKAAPVTARALPEEIVSKPIEKPVEAPIEEPSPQAEPVAGDNLYRLQKQTEGAQLSPEEQAYRAQVLQRIGMEDARQSAITGDSMEGATQAQMAKFTEEPAGRAANQLFNNERTILSDHAKTIIDDTGGSAGMDASTLNARGQAIAAPLDSLRDYFNNSIKKLYDAADERSGNTPSIILSDLSNMLKEDHTFQGIAEKDQLRTGIKSYMKRFGIVDSDGNPLPITAQQAEGLRQYINSNLQPKTSGLIGELKDTIDNDVFKNAGADIYSEARRLFQEKKATLDNPAGMAKITELDTQTPINRSTPFEKIPDTLTNLPISQFGHVVDVLNKILDPQYPEPLRVQAINALNEIKAHMANSLYETGSKYQTKWNAPGVTSYLKNNAPKFQMLFDGAELQKISDLNDAGHILSVDKSYPGAAAQGAAAVKRGLLPNIASKSLAGAGGLIGSVAGPIGTAAGSAAGAAAGDTVASTLAGRAALNRFKQGIVNINDYLKQGKEEAKAPIQNPSLNYVPKELKEGAIAASAAEAAINHANEKRSSISKEINTIKSARRSIAMAKLSESKSVDDAIRAAQEAAK